MTNNQHISAGFSLVQMAIILTVIAVIAAAALPGNMEMGNLAQKDLTVKRMFAIENAIRGWRSANNGKLPCPADGTLAITDNNFGVKAANEGACTGGTPAANFGPSGNVVAGMVPVRSLGLPDNYALDGWGHRFTYAVDMRVTGGGAKGAFIVNENQQQVYSGSTSVSFGSTAVGGLITAGERVWIENAITLGGINASDINGARTVLNLTGPTLANGFTVTAGATATSSPATTALAPNASIYRYDSYCDTLTTAGAPYAITISDGTSTIDTAMSVLISHGKNGHGAFPANGSAVTARINAGSTDTGELENASVNTSFTTSFNATFVKKEESFSSSTRSSLFDDIVRYGKRCK